MSFANPLPPLSLYIHYPWCIKKCPYCDFNSHKKKNQEINDKQYVDALVQDLSNDLTLVWGRRIQSIFIGGGTPSLISPEALDYLFVQLRALLNISPSIEITLEANPGTVEQNKFSDFKHIGINRLSIGVQSFNNDFLVKLGRIHNATEAHKAIDVAHTVGFENFNIDLMYALPEQTKKQALDDLAEAFSHKPQHLSYYQLTIEPNTFFAKQPPRLPNDDVAFQIQTSAYNRLEEQGFTRYEISAWAQKDNNLKSKHNLNYWEFGDYLGIGAGAHSKITRADNKSTTRLSKVKHPELYILAHTRKESFIATSKTLNKNDLCFEFMLNSSRLINGFPIALFSQTTGLPFQSIQPSIELAIEKGLMIQKNDIIKPTRLGLNYLNDLQLIFLN